MIQISMLPRLIRLRKLIQRYLIPCSFKQIKLDFLSTSLASPRQVIFTSPAKLLIMNLRIHLLALAGLFTTRASSIQIAPNVHGCTVESTKGDISNIRIYYQDADTSLVEILPSFPASNGYTYGAFILARGVAKVNTPLACTAFYNDDGGFAQVCLLSFLLIHNTSLVLLSAISFRLSGDLCAFG